MQSISILGSTGSIGTQTLQVCRDLSIKVNAISANSNIDLLEKQAREFSVKIVGVYNKQAAAVLKERLADTDIEVLSGEQGNIAVATFKDSSTVVTAMSGMIGLVPTVEAIKVGKTLALANKETLVCAGHIIMPLAKKHNVKILPVDSEHSAIFQCVNACEGNKINKIILTASGGPFFAKKESELVHITKADALKHPNWSMGSKITIDSATLMNKGLEIIEAKWLFDVDIDDIEVVVHRESIIHSAVEFVDGNVIAQLSNPDMRLPISYAISYPDRVEIPYRKLKLAEIGKMSFYEPDLETFGCLKLCIDSVARGGNSGAVINGANEEAVKLFLNDKIGFLDIYNCVKYAYDNVEYIENPDINDIFESDKQARACVNNYIMR